MENHRIKILLAIGLVAIMGILAIQLLWLKEAFDQEAKKFDQKVHIGLLEVVKKLMADNEGELPQINPIKQISNDYYIININDDFSAEVLEFYLKNEFEKLQVNTDYEYAIYDCNTDNMVYGNYINYNPNSKVKKTNYFPKMNQLVYYFAIRFPNKFNYYFLSLRTWIILSSIMLLVLVIYVYSIFVILQQKRYSELQKDFINNMTHEFKTPLSSILIASDFLSKQDVIVAEPRLAKYTSTILNQGKRLNHHVEKILNLAKSEKHSIQLEMHRVNLNDTIAMVIDNIKLKYGEDVQFKANLNSENAEALADEIHFTNLLYNLFDNAIKYCDGPAMIDIDLIPKAEKWELSISDNGRGIDKQHIKHIFKKFYRVPVANNKHINGFGLGLYYVKQVCQLHHWDIRCESKHKKGTTFIITIPKIEGNG